MMASAVDTVAERHGRFSVTGLTCFLVSIVVTVWVAFWIAVDRALNGSLRSTAPGMHPSVAASPWWPLLVLALASYPYFHAGHQRGRELVGAGLLASVCAALYIEPRSDLIPVVWWLFPVCGVVSLATAVGRRARHVHGIVAGGVVAILCVAAVAGARLTQPTRRVFSDDLTPRQFYSANRGEFAAVARYAQSSDVGLQLPAHLCAVAADCSISDAGESSYGVTAPYLPYAVWTLGHSDGFARIGRPAAGDQWGYDGIGLCPRYEVGDGWWWMTEC